MKIGDVVQTRLRKRKIVALNGTHVWYENFANVKGVWTFTNIGRATVFQFSKWGGKLEQQSGTAQGKEGFSEVYEEKDNNSHLR